jgi:type VI secretion system protein ImpA
MASELDFSVLLAPIAGDRPTGADPRQDFDPASLYFRLRDARAEARAAERQADASGLEEEAPVAQWAPVLGLGLQLLMTEAKDLEVAAWCAEALLRTEGLAGFAAGCRLMLGLVENFWDGLHPMPEEGGMADRLAPISGLNGEGGDGTLIQPLRKVVLFTRPDGAGVALWQFQQSLEAAGTGDAARRDQRIAAGVLPFAQLEADAAAAGVAAFRRLRAAATAAADAWRALSNAVDERAGRDAPSTTRVRDLLDDIVSIADRFAPLVAELPAAHDAPADVAMAAETGTRTITTREDALRVLGEVAAYFQRNEPHSPIAYTLYEAIRRGRLSWPELLEEIVPDTDIRDAILRSLGIRPSSPPE